METRKIIGVVAMIGIVFSGSLASAQHLMDDNVWFKMKMSVKGHSGILEGEDLLIEPYSNVSTVYVRFSPASNAFQHTWELWTLNPTTSEWENYDSGTEYINGGGDGIVIEWSPSWNAGYDTFDAIINGFMKIKRDGLVTKSATFTSTGCLLDGHWVASIYGGCKVTGSAIKPDKLPFPYP
jgi:hypothetical protein